MNIVMLSARDCCASGLRICEAINENTKHTIKLYQFMANPFDHPRGEFVTKKNTNKKIDRSIKAKNEFRKGIIRERCKGGDVTALVKSHIEELNLKKHNKIQKEIDRADIIHVKGDLTWTDSYPGIKHYPSVRINHKPIIVTLSGTLTRGEKFGGLLQCNRQTYQHAKIVTAIEPDLMHDWVDYLTYYPIRRVEPLWKQSDPPILQHIPSDRIGKGTKFLLEVLEKLNKKVTFELHENITYREVLEVKKRATLFFDQFRCGWYGNNAVEAMNYGVPVATWISDFSRRSVGEPPIITSNGGAEDWAKEIDKILDSDMTELSRQTKEYCDEYHSYEAVAKQWNGIYKLL